MPRPRLRRRCTRAIPALTSLVMLAGLAVAGCGSGGGETSTTTTTTTKTVELRKHESSDPMPKLRRGWEVVKVPRGGFAVARPPGWAPKRRGSALAILSPDRLVAVTLSADRTPSGLAISPQRYAARTAQSLDDYRGKLEPSKPRPFRHRYDGVQVVERARSKEGVPQEVRVIVLRRPKLVTFTAVIARNANRPDASENEQALAIVRTIRSRPGAGKPKHHKASEKRGRKKDGGG